MELILVGDELPQEALSVELCDAESGRRLDLPALDLTPVGVRLARRCRSPIRHRLLQMIARLREFDLQTAIPLCIVPRQGA